MMSRWRARRARTLILVCFFIVLVGTLAAYLARRRTPRTEPPPHAEIAADIGKKTQSFSLSKTLENRTLYTINAERVTNYEESGKALLHGVSVVIFGKDGTRQDRIRSPEAVYDPASSSVWIPGEVEMEFALALPPSDPSSPPAGPATTPVSIFTSKLSFEQSSGIASTDAPVRFRFPEGEG